MKNFSTVILGQNFDLTLASLLRKLDRVSTVLGKVLGDVLKTLRLSKPV